MNLYRGILRPIFFRFSAEVAHEMALSFLKAFSGAPGLLRMMWGASPSYPVDFTGLRFPNPIGLAAGMDKDAVALPAWEALGFGFVEVGTITALAQPGNPKPRLFRYPEKRALVNRMGFNNEGCEAVARRLEKLRASSRNPRIPVGINIGKSKVTPLEEAAGDYLKSYRRLYELGDYFVVNVSSPNTPGLRSLQAADGLEKILGELRGWEGEKRKPLWVKLAPDLAREDAVAAARVAEAMGVDALVATNTTLDHGALLPGEDQVGGLSGAPLRERAREMLVLLRSETGLPIVASGGMMNRDDALDRLRIGAGLVQVYTGFIYEGPALLRQMCP